MALEFHPFTKFIVEKIRDSMLALGETAVNYVQFFTYFCLAMKELQAKPLYKTNLNRWRWGLSIIEMCNLHIEKETIDGVYAKHIRDEQIARCIYAFFFAPRCVTEDYIHLMPTRDNTASLFGDGYRQVCTADVSRDVRRTCENIGHKTYWKPFPSSGGDGDGGGDGGVRSADEFEAAFPSVPTALPTRAVVPAPAAGSAGRVAVAIALENGGRRRRQRLAIRRYLK